MPYTTVPRRQWPRVDPTATFFKNNSFCEDGLPSTVGNPAGEYYILFAHQCATDVTIVTSGTYSGCGKQPYVPCKPVRIPLVSLLVLAHAHTAARL
jgi:hypothetical protein